MSNEATANNVLVEALGSSLRSGGHALADAPELLKKLLAEQAWRDFVTRRGEHVTHGRFAGTYALRFRRAGAAMIGSIGPGTNIQIGG